MLIEEYLGIIDGAPKSMHSVLTSMMEMEKSIQEEKKLLEKEMEKIFLDFKEEKEELSHTKEEIDQKLQKINKLYLKVLDVDKKKLTMLLALQKKLLGVSETMKKSSVEFREGIAKGVLFYKTKKILQHLEHSVPFDRNNEKYSQCCICKRSPTNEMIACDNSKCTVGWYHISCLGIKAVPKKKWLCSLCITEENE
ncbi:hypothetical protein NEFER03_1863 [Nematocida sp. LUAm3]|nr:hypothetical protein NEFER03_1863 [Nematocida sp. LUAm3]KAI5173987.1 hypothetical protein NEFER02_0454 [Nematocida sp. LUAm2]KAI5177268.1 hypothetical protein NEFER01_0543 [Nematocida sp. LUAm1]